MCRTTRNVLRLILSLALTTVLASCGNGESEDDDLYINLFSSGVYGEHSLAFNGAGTKLYGWGANGYGQLGVGSRMDNNNPEAVIIPARITGYSKVSIGGAHGVAIDSNGNVYAWGHNTSGQLGDNTLTTRTTPDEVLGINGSSPLTGITEVAAGVRHTLALTTEGTVLAWGNNARGQLGNGATEKSKIPVQVMDSEGRFPLSGITAIAAGGDFSLALDTNNTVWAWGSNSYGQLGNGGTPSSSLRPVQVKIRDENQETKVVTYAVTLDNITKIAAGGSHALAIDGDGNIWAWGYNGLGQLGDGKKITKKGAVLLVLTDKDKKPIVGTATAISAGLDHTLTVLNNAGVATVYAWGYNKSGQLGNGAALDSEIPVTAPTKVKIKVGTELQDLPGIVSVTAVGQHSMARTGDTNGQSTLYTWGKNSRGQLGDGTRVSRSHAAQVVFPTE